eukprot:Colp12_sorted_trinity150504_noHs@4585
MSKVAPILCDPTAPVDGLSVAYSRDAITFEGADIFQAQQQKDDGQPFEPAVSQDGKASSEQLPVCLFTHLHVAEPVKYIKQRLIAEVVFKDYRRPVLAFLNHTYMHVATTGAMAAGLVLALLILFGVSV